VAKQNIGYGVLNAVVEIDKTVSLNAFLQDAGYRGTDPMEV
jgi:hypothetical protein